ncbi:DUF3466 family protein [Shewanella submarina]|uniref:DUF3466 family protein n=1 Tax=Shewanella submarina TaxID=2016376 RepID=A0ABV7GH25_9GAMM|nr:DUF3466 family protein [Shewanella submarina]MCL1037479.1 DUF3466 family protein [Shewanella submarina]
MKLSLDKTLSLVALSVVGALGTLPAYAALEDQAYEVVNIEDFDLKGTLPDTQRGYGMGINADGEMVGVSRGRKKLRDEDVDDGIIDVEDGIAPEEQITFSVDEPIIANNFTFISSANQPAGEWVPTFDSLGGSTAPNTTPPNSVDAIYYGINDAGIKVGSVSAPEKKLTYEGDNEDQEFWYYRDFELRAIAKKADGSEVEIAPPFTTYVYEAENEAPVDVLVGGWSVAANINNNQQVVGYASTDISDFGADRIKACFGDDVTLPLDICVQANQFPSATGSRNIQYQTRAFVWDLDNAGGVTATELPLGLTPAADSELIFTAQGLGINSSGVVAGRSDTYRDGDTDDRRLDAGYWLQEANDSGTEAYVFKPVPFPDREYYNTIAYDVNDDGLLIGTYDRYIEGYLRTKFFTFDTVNGGQITTPLDFYGNISDLSSTPRDINNQGKVVGSIDITHDKETPRPRSGFLYDSAAAELVDLNKVLTCESKGLEADGNGSWKRHEVQVTDGTGLELSYRAEIRVVDADSIAEDGTIVGTAFVRKPMYQVDLNGDLVLENGQPVFELNANGQPLTSFLPRAVVLKPSNGAICTYVDPDDDDAPYERKGAAGLGWLMLLPLLWVRRKIIG